MIFALLCYLLAIAMSGAWRPDGAVPRLRPPALFEPGANPLSAAERPAAARGLEAAAKEGSPMGDPFASTSAPASDHSPKSAASASGAKALRGSLGVEAQSQGKFAQSSVPAPRRAALEAKASGVDVAAPRSENEDSADDDGFEPRRERTHPSAPASAVEDLLVREGSLGGGGRRLEDTAEDPPPFCILRNTAVCWGNEHHYVDGLLLENTDFFDGIDVGFESAPALADLDDDGDLDLVVGEYDGVLNYYENVGNATSPTYEAVTGAANPFDGVDVGWYSTPALADVDLSLIHI